VRLTIVLYFAGVQPFFYILQMLHPMLIIAQCVIVVISDLVAAVVFLYREYESDDPNASPGLVISDLLQGRELSPREQQAANKMKSKADFTRKVLLIAAWLLQTHTEDGRAWKGLGCSLEEQEVASEALSDAETALGIESLEDFLPGPPFKRPRKN